MMAIPSEDVIFNALNHEIRREILRLLNKRPLAYSQLMEHFAITSGKLNYHLKLLTGFIDKDEGGLYQNTALGARILNILEGFHDTIEDDDLPLIKRAYITQQEESKSYLHLRLVGGLQMKIILIVAIAILITVMMVFYAAEGVDIGKMWPLFAVAIPIIIIGLIWLYRMYRPAKEFAKRVDKLLKDEATSSASEEMS